MYGMDQADLDHPFMFAKQSCTGRDIFNALSAAYPGLTWTADDRTGMVWFHPRLEPLSGILPQRIEISDDQYGLPMLGGVLEPLSESSTLGLRAGARLYYVFAGAVDFPRGTYTVRDIVSLCCVSDPGISLRVMKDSKRGFVMLEPVSFYPFPKIGRNIRPGALLLWRREIGPADISAPTVDDLRARLVDRDPVVRRAAQRYYLATDYVYGGPAILSGTMPLEQQVAACLAEIAMRARLPGMVHCEATQTLQAALTDEFIANGDPALVVPGCMELARLAKDDRPLDRLSRRQFAPGELDGIVPEVYRIARLSPTVREYFAKKGMGSLTTGAAKLADLPTKATPKLVFSVLQTPKAEQK